MRHDILYPDTGRRTCWWTVWLRLISAGVSGLLLVACGQDQMAPTPVPTHTPADIPTQPSAQAPASTPTPTMMPAPVSTLTKAPTSKPVSSPAPTLTPIPTPVPKLTPILVPAPTLTPILIPAPTINDYEGQQVAFERATFNVELAVTPEQIARGLMGRQHLDDREGMLFIFKAEGLHSFWMKGMVISLDIVWIDADSTVTGVTANVPPATESTVPSSYSPPQPILYVLEINGGRAEEAGIRAGSVVEFVPKLPR